MIVEAVCAILVVFGASFMLLGSVGLARLPDIYSRLHAPTKAATLGIGAILLASIIQSSAATGSLALRDVVIALFLFLTAPVSAHVLAKAALAKRKQGEDLKPDTN